LVGAKKAHRDKKPLIEKVHKAKNPIKALWYKASPWSFCF